MPTTTSLRRLLSTAAVAAAAAAAVNAVIFGIGRAAGVDFAIDQTATGVQRVAVTDVVTVTLMAFAVGLVAAVIAGRLRRPSVRTLQILGGVIAVVSVAMDVGIDATAPAKVLLASMHLVAGAAYVACLEVASRRRSVAAAPVITLPTERRRLAA